MISARGRPTVPAIANAHVADRTGLRDDNAELRLTPLGASLGSLRRIACWRCARGRPHLMRRSPRYVGCAWRPTARINARLTATGLAPLRAAVAAEALLRRPHTTYAQIQQALDLPPLDAAAAAIVEAEGSLCALAQPRVSCLLARTHPFGLRC